jgi:hypothetical protein
MKRILVLQSDENIMSKVEVWVDINYPNVDKYQVDWETVLTPHLNNALRNYDVIVFSGMVNESDIGVFLRVRSWWQGKLFVYFDDDPKTLEFSEKLSRGRVQNFRVR